MIKEAIILAGGKGTRLAAVVTDLPKPMAQVNGRPFLEWQFDFLLSYGITKTIISCGFKAEAIQTYFGTRYRDLQLEYAVESKPLGTGGGLKFALEHATEDDLLVLNGDTFFPVDIHELSLIHKNKQALFTIAGKVIEDVSRYGSLEIDGNSKLVGFREKGKQGQGLINGGVYLINKELFSNYPETVFSLESEFLSPRLKEINVAVHASNAHFIDIGIPEDYQVAQTFIPEIASRPFKPDKDWTLFLDRDGVINLKKDGDYIRTPEEFFFLEGSPQAVAQLNKIFGKTILVTNQQGIGRQLFTAADLEKVHQHMLDELMQAGAGFDALFFAPYLARDQHPDRKPGTGMGVRAKEKFPQIDFRKSVMVGDSLTDLEFGKALGMFTVYIHALNERPALADYVFPSLKAMVNWMLTAPEKNF